MSLPIPRLSSIHRALDLWGRRLSLLVLPGLIAPAWGCRKGDDAQAADETPEASPQPRSAPATRPATNVMAGAVYKTVPGSNVQVPIPRSWRLSKKGLYAFAVSADKKALLAFTTVSSVGEYVGRSQHAQRTFDITDCTKSPAKKLSIGPNKLPASVVDFVCKFNGVPAFVSTALVNTGKRSLPFIIYAVDKRASKETTRQAQLTVLGMRKR